MRCEASLFRTITLGRLIIPPALLSKLSQHGHPFAEHVRHLVVSSEYVSDQTIVSILRNLPNLASLSWNVDKHIPAAVLDSFHRTHPEAHLKVTNHSRQGILLDETLLLSPQLHTLDISVGCILHGNLGYITELPALEDLLIRGGSLKVLRLHLTRLEHGSKAVRTRYHECLLADDGPLNVSIDRGDTAAARTPFQGYCAADAGPLNFRFEDGDTFPALEELVIKQEKVKSGQRRSAGAAYDFSAKHCEDWAHCMDWGQLRTLDLVSSPHPRYLLRSIAEAVPLLETLRFEAFPDPDNALTSLLHQTPKLETLHMKSNPLDTVESAFEAAVLTICATVGPQLHSLALECNVRRRVEWQSNHLRTLLTACAKLRRLKVVVGTAMVDGVRAPDQVEGDWKADEVGIGPEEKFDRMIVPGVDGRGDEESCRTGLDA
jgi:hypothetical protein